MKIAISNIAWDIKADNVIKKILNEYEIEGIEIAPTKIWTDPSNVNKSDILSYKSYWKQNGIKIVAMQSLLFGHPELTIFETSTKRKAAITYLEKIIHLASLLGVKAMVFGSPKNRIKGNLESKDVNEIANSFFSKVGDISKKYNIHFCIEANPKVYGTDFLNTTAEVVSFVRKLNHPYIKVHIDTGAMHINNENIDETITIADPFFHCHISEPNLLSVPQEVNHELVAKSLINLNYKKWVSIEMRQLENEYNIMQIKNTLEYVTKIYR